MPQPTRTFRIFVSSTFSDLKEERNALHRKVFPTLKTLCEENKARFQAIDLRWGVREEAGLDQRAMRICLDEVKRCQEVTPKPNFLILLGDRYGWRPLPAEIPADEWKLIEDQLRSLGEEGERRLERLAEWYELDKNARPDGDPPGIWLLRPRTEEEWGTPDYEEFELWDREVERPLREILVEATAKLNLSEAARLKYGGSATEQEIARGALSVQDADQHVFCFLRTIDGLPEDESAKDFRDLVPADPGDPASARRVPDVEADTRLAVLKGSEEEAQEERIDGRPRSLRSHLPAENIFDEYRAEWIGRDPTEEASDGEEPADSDDRVDEGPPPISTTHIDKLCEDVERVLRKVILTELERLDREKEKRTDVDEEAAAHEAFARERLGSRRDPERSIFVGREGTLERIAAYVAQADPHPLALIGQPGSGKSAVMARAFEQAGETHRGAQVICRFIGWTPGSAVVRELLDKLCRQISRIYGQDEETPSEYRELVQEFPKRLAFATEGQPLILFLDALDQLTDADHARNLIWLPTELPRHVRLVVSTSTEPEDTHAVLERRLPGDARFTLDDMPVEEAHALLGEWFDDVGRTLQGRGNTYSHSEGQWRYVLDRYSGCPRPLYLRLAFEEARRWRSLDPVEDAEVAGGDRAFHLAPDIPSLIEQLFERLSSPANHGQTVVSRSLGYLVAGKNGLSEDELIEVLSRDERVLAEVKKFHRPPEEKLPVVIWSRLYFDLEPYLTQRRADETSLLAFYHRQLDAVARREYLEPCRVERHQALAEYFADQDLLLGEAKTGNVRVLSELPYQQTYAADPNDSDDEMWERLYATLTDFDFLEAKCTYVAVTTQGSGEDERKVYGGVYELQEDYRRALDVFPAE